MAKKKPAESAGLSSYAMKGGGDSILIPAPTLHERLLAADAALVDAAANFTDGDAHSLRQLRACAIDYARTADEVDDLEEGK